MDDLTIDPKYVSSLTMQGRIADLERQLKVQKDENRWLRDHDNEWCTFYYQVKEKDAEIQRYKNLATLASRSLKQLIKEDERVLQEMSEEIKRLTHGLEHIMWTGHISPTPPLLDCCEKAGRQALMGEKK